MRIFKRNDIITIKALKRHDQLILEESGCNYQIEPNDYSKSIPFAEWFYWVLKKKGYKHKVLKVYRF